MFTHSPYLTERRGTNCQAVTQGDKYVAEFSCAGDLTTNPVGRAAHLDLCNEIYVTGDDVYKPEDVAVPGKYVSTATRTSDTVVFQTTECGVDAKGAYCDEYDLSMYDNGDPYNLGCGGQDWSQATFRVLGPSSTSPSWPVGWTACTAHDNDPAPNNEFMFDTDYDHPDAQLAYTTGGPQFYIEQKYTCEPGVGEYSIWRFRLGGNDRDMPVQSFTSTYTCSEPYPVYRQEFEKKSDEKKSGDVKESMVTASAPSRAVAPPLAATILAVAMLSLL